MIRSKSVTDQVAEELKKLILSGEYKEGDKFLPEQTIGKMLNVGRSTVREALRVLQTMKYLEILPGRGAFIKNLTPDNIDIVRDWFVEHSPQLSELFEVRLHNEILAVKLACENRTDNDIRLLKDNCEKFFCAMERTDVPAMVQLDEEFHSIIVNASGNTVLGKIYSLLVEAVRESRSMSFSFRKNAQTAYKEHTKLVESISEQNFPKSRRRIEKHLTEWWAQFSN